MEKVKCFASVSLLFILSFLPSSLQAADEKRALELNPRPLKLLVCPAHDIRRVQSEYLPMLESLQTDLGRRIRLFCVQRYARLTKLLEQGSFDLAILSANALSRLEGRKLRARVNVIASQVLDNKARYRGVVVTLEDSPIETMADLAGKTLIIPDYRSHSSWISLSEYFAERSLNPSRFLGRIEQAGGHVAALRMLFDGGDGAAAVSSLTFYEAQRRGLEVEKLRTLHKTSLIPFDAFCVSRDMSESFKRRISLSLLSFKGRTTIDRIVMEWRRATDESYDG